MSNLVKVRFLLAQWSLVKDGLEVRQLEVFHAAGSKTKKMNQILVVGRCDTVPKLDVVRSVLTENTFYGAFLSKQRTL